ncbi:tRNA pseudouridine synthase B [gamma proteobacterium HTCC5015]|nr:tRNA pseudouridine synthase B [gamma proteobacterium HTCC5015]
MGRRPKKRGRDVHGVLLLDKPQGLTANQALQRVKRLFKANRAGHTGTLDPMATGLLPICLGEATKISAYLLDADKAYRAQIQLGQRTDTADADGEVIEEKSIPQDWGERVEPLLNRLEGECEQTPPMYSALKVDGKPLYKYARDGVEIERKRRRVVLHELRLESLGSTEFSLYVRCSKGTYIRSLAEDIGEALSCGAHLTALRRCEVAPYDTSHMVSLETLQTLSEGEASLEALDQHLLPVDTAITDWPKLVLNRTEVDRLEMGQALGGMSCSVGWYRVYDQSDQLKLLAECEETSVLRPRRRLHIA